MTLQYLGAQLRLEKLSRSHDSFSRSIILKLIKLDKVQKRERSQWENRDDDGFRLVEIKLLLWSVTELYPLKALLRIETHGSYCSKIQINFLNNL